MAKKNLGAITALVPLPAVMVSCQKPDSKPNIITISWTGIVCSEPPMISISVRKNRYSYDLIKSTGEFVVNITNHELAVNITNHELAKATDLCGTYSGKDYDKFEMAGLTPEKASKVRVPMIAECPINMECQVRTRIELGSHDIFIAEIVAAHADESILIDGRFDIEKLDPLIYCTKARQYWSGLSRNEGKYGFTVEKSR
jgi:flavin reductase (DIM6/NTAB) family NADH-FMN oxidoreductase RutF